MICKWNVFSKDFSILKKTFKIVVLRFLNVYLSFPLDNLYHIYIWIPFEFLFVFTSVKPIPSSFYLLFQNVVIPVYM